MSLAFLVSSSGGDASGGVNIPSGGADCDFSEAIERVEVVEATVGEIDSAVDEIIKVQEELMDGDIEISTGEGEQSTVNPYPVGAIYMSVSATDPASIFGGTWERLTDRFLVGAGGTYSVGNTGGVSSVELTESHLPPQTVMEYADQSAASGNQLTIQAPDMYDIKLTYGLLTDVYLPIAKRDELYNHNDISQQAVSTLPPYLAVYMWKRLA